MAQKVRTLTMNPETPLNIKRETIPTSMLMRAHTHLNVKVNQTLSLFDSSLDLEHHLLPLHAIHSGLGPTLYLPIIAE